jgi:hypothetical protein
MGLFTKSKSLKFKKIPSTPEQNQARSYLEGLYQKDLQYPTEQIADLTGTEQQIQGQLPDYLRNTQADYETGRSYLNDVLAGGYDPRSSDYYAGLRQESEQLKAGSQNEIRRQSQKAGMARSTPSLGIQADVGEKYDTQTLKNLGALYENERMRMGQAAAGLGQLSSQYIGNVGAAESIAETERFVQQDRMRAMFTAAVQNMLAPYLKPEGGVSQAGIALNLLNEKRYAGVETGGGLTDFGFATSLFSSAYSTYAINDAIKSLQVA